MWMKRMANEQKVPALIGLILLVLFGLTGCPSQPPTTNPPTVVECKEGAACLDIKSDVRSCEMLFTNDKILETPEVGFDTGVIGQFKASGARVAVAFVMKKDEKPSEAASAVVLRLKDGVANLKLEKLTCYDRTGNKVDNVDAELRRP